MTGSRPAHARVIAANGYDRAKRLRKTDEISSVFRFRRGQAGVWLQVQWMPNGLPHPRMAVAVAKKIERRAVGRNYMKRALREAFRQQQHELGAFDIVIRVRKRFDSTQAPQVRSELGRLFKGLGHGASPGGTG